MAANKSHEASSSSSRGIWRYDVFLSFRGDTRRNFTDHLYIALQDAGINVFRDDNELRVGKNISTELLEAIQDSRISTIVFSRDYVASSWCLEELVKIMECRETVQQVVQPVFYKVDPSDVRKQSGSFAEAFAQHEKRFTAEKEKVLRWRNALTEAANLKGFHYTPDRHEGGFIKEIVDEILNHVNNTYLNEAIYPVGLEPRVQENPRFVLVEGKEIPSHFCHQSISPLLCLPVLRDFEDAVLDVCILYEYGDVNNTSLLWLRRYGGLVLRSGDQLELLIRHAEYVKVKKWGVHLNDKYKGGTIQSNGVNQILHNNCSNDVISFRVGYNDDPFGIDLNIKPT